MKNAITIEIVGASVLVTFPLDHLPGEAYRAAARIRRQVEAERVVVADHEGGKLVIVCCASLALARYARAEVERLVACDPMPMAVSR